MLNEIAIPTAFVAGIVSFLSPCVLPLVPGYISYVSGNALTDIGRSTATRLSTLGLGLCFVLGFSSVFVALSRLLLSYRYEANLVGGAVIIVFGIFMTGLVRMPWLQRDTRFHGGIRGGRPAGAYVLGLAFGFGWTPCIGPVLGAILTLSAVSATASTGIVLLSVYALGLGLPFLLSTVFAAALLRRRKEIGRLGRALRFGAGGIMIVMGVAMMTGTMTVFSFWLLETFPVFASIG